jgi:hypothetical protein
VCFVRHSRVVIRLLPLCVSLVAACSDPDPSSLCPVGSEGPVGFQRFDDVVTRWGAITCIPVAVDPALTTFEPEIAAALGAWSDFECTDLCFARVDSIAGGGIEIRSGAGAETTGRVSLEFNVRSGAVQHGVIEAVPGHPDFTPRLFSYWVGLALGLSSSAGVDSMLDITRVRDGVLTMPTALDEAAVCALYRRDCE